jgi:uncharacterized membrane protein YfcA
MIAGETTAQVLGVLFLATLIRAAFGFGEALIAVPLLALIVPVEVAAPVAALISVTVAALVLVQDWSDVHTESAGRLVLATLPGIPLGLLLLTRVPEAMVKATLACIIIAFSVYSLSSRRRLALQSDTHAWLAGFFAGVLGGAYGMNGPPLVIYGTLRGWSPQRFRATLQGYFLPASLIVVAGYGVAGLLTSTVRHYYLLSLPAVLVASIMGRHINRRLRGPRFLAVVHAGLVLIGATLLMQALRV